MLEIVVLVLYSGFHLLLASGLFVKCNRVSAGQIKNTAGVEHAFDHVYQDILASMSWNDNN